MNFSGRKALEGHQCHRHATGAAFSARTAAASLTISSAQSRQSSPMPRPSCDGNRTWKRLSCRRCSTTFSGLIRFPSRATSLGEGEEIEFGLRAGWAGGRHGVVLAAARLVRQTRGHRGGIDLAKSIRRNPVSYTPSHNFAGKRARPVVQRHIASPSRSAG